MNSLNDGRWANARYLIFHIVIDFQMNIQRLTRDKFVNISTQMIAMQHALRTETNGKSVLNENISNWTEQMGSTVAMQFRIKFQIILKMCNRLVFVHWISLDFIVHFSRYFEKLTNFQIINIVNLIDFPIQIWGHTSLNVTCGFKWFWLIRRKICLKKRNELNSFCY